MTFTWYATADTLSNWEWVAESNSPIFIPSPPEEVTYYRVWVESNGGEVPQTGSGCGVYSNAISVGLAQPMFPQAFVFGDQEVCAGSPFNALSVLTDGTVPESDLSWVWETRDFGAVEWNEVEDGQGLSIIPPPGPSDRWFRPIATELATGHACNMVYDSVEVMVNELWVEELVEVAQGCPEEDQPTFSLNVIGDGDINAIWQMSNSSEGPWSFAGNGLDLTPSGIFEDTLYFRSVVISVGNSTFCQVITNSILTAPLPDDAIGICGGPCLYDVDQNGVCDLQQSTGCTDMTACNFISGATVDDGSCFYPEPGLNCDGGCLVDTDGDGICEQDEITGCLDAEALNFNPNATDAGDCSYGSSCVGDLNGDATVGISDLLMLLSAFNGLCD